jgi:hypothetical protein
VCIDSCWQTSEKSVPLKTNNNVKQNQGKHLRQVSIFLARDLVLGKSEKVLIKFSFFSNLIIYCSLSLPFMSDILGNKGDMIQQERQF